MAKVPFSDEIAFLVMDKLKDPDFVQSLVDQLRRLFKVSEFSVVDVYPVHSSFFIPPLQTDKGYDRSTFDKQMAVMRGQVRHCRLSMAHMLPLGAGV